MITSLSEMITDDRAVLGGKAAALAQMSAAGFAVPSGLVATAQDLADPDFDERVRAAAKRLGGPHFAVRSSGAAEDLPDASYAGLYETYLNVPAEDIPGAVRRCFAAATAERVTAYHQRHSRTPGAMAVLVQVMVEPAAAGVVFTAHPVTGDRDQTVVTAVRGLGEPLVSGAATGEEWIFAGGPGAVRSRPSPDGDVLTADQAAEIAGLARRVATLWKGTPQDVEWAIDQAGKLWLLQARPMTAVPQVMSWTPPGPGLWMRNFRLGEWLPEAVTPSFATWLLPLLEGGYLNGMAASVGVRVPFRYALVNGWYYNATPLPSPRLLGRVLLRGRLRTVKILFNALFRVGTNPDAADRAVLGGLEREWRHGQLRRYQQMVVDAAAEVETARPGRLVEIVNLLGREAGVALWYLAIVGGSAWKMEGALTRFTREHLANALPASDGGAQVLLRGLPGAWPMLTAHAVHSVDWYHPLALQTPGSAPSLAPEPRHAALAEQRVAAEQRCRAELSAHTRLLNTYERLLAVNQRYAVIREEQARQLTLAWPVLRACAERIGQLLADGSVLEDPADIYFCEQSEIVAAVNGHSVKPIAVAERRQLWERRRRLAAPLTLGRPSRLIGDVIDRAVREARGAAEPVDGAIIGHPASAGRATGPVRIINAPDEFASFTDGDVLVARATAPAWTPLFARAAAVVTDGGTLAAHASLVAREFGIPAVVGTGDATRQLKTGQIVTVDGTTGTVTIDPHWVS